MPPIFIISLYFLVLVLLTREKEDAWVGGGRGWDQRFLETMVASAIYKSWTHVIHNV